jgi:hypothetical protein
MEPEELKVPAAALNNESAKEIIRVWVASGSQHMSIATGVWRDPAAWGMMLADLAKHIANAYSQAEGMEFEAALARIRQGFDVEWDHPTDEPSGKVGG